MSVWARRAGTLELSCCARAANAILIGTNTVIMAEGSLSFISRPVACTAVRGPVNPPFNQAADGHWNAESYFYGLFIIPVMNPYRLSGFSCKHVDILDSRPWNQSAIGQAQW